MPKPAFKLPIPAALTNLLATGLLASALTVPASAAQSLSLVAHAAPHALPVLAADYRCGPGHHFVPRHRWHGRWIRAYCARNIRHRRHGY